MGEAEPVLPDDGMDMDVPMDFHHMNPGDDGTLDICPVCNRHLNRGDLIKHRALNEMISKLQPRSRTSSHSTSTSSVTGAAPASSIPVIDKEDRLLASCAGLIDSHDVQMRSTRYQDGCLLGSQSLHLVLRARVMVLLAERNRYQRTILWHWSLCQEFS